MICSWTDLLERGLDMLDRDGLCLVECGGHHRAVVRHDQHTDE